MRKTLTQLTAEEREAIWTDRSIPPEWLVVTTPLTPEERAALLSVSRISAEDLDRPLTAEDRLPPHPPWFRPEEIDWAAAPIRAVLDAMPEGTHLKAAVGFLLTPQPDLEREDGSACRPVDWLAKGRDLEPVLELASGLNEAI